MFSVYHFLLFFFFSVSRVIVLGILWRTNNYLLAFRIRATTIFKLVSTASPVVLLTKEREVRSFVTTRNSTESGRSRDRSQVAAGVKYGEFLSRDKSRGFSPEKR